MSSPRSLELAAAADAGLEQLLTVLDRNASASLGEAWKGRRVADLVAHLVVWHVLFQGWVSLARSGATPDLPAEGYTWDQLDQLNDDLYEKHRNDSYETMRAQLLVSHASVLDVLADATQEELTGFGIFPWLNGESLGGTAEHCLTNHYRWGLERAQAAGLN